MTLPLPPVIAAPPRTAAAMTSSSEPVRVCGLARRSFAGRASASQVVAAGLPQLVASDPDAYAAIAARIVADAGWRDECRAGAAAARTSALFDMGGYAARFAALLTDATR